MSIKCQAVVEHGLLRPVIDLGLPDAERVIITVDRLPATIGELSVARQRLSGAGIFHLGFADACALAGSDVSVVDRDEINRRLPLAIRGRPMSATVIEERREGW